MALKIISTHSNGLILSESIAYTDERGFFMESFRAEDYSAIGINEPFVQDNHSGSKRGVVRGMHFQWDKPQGKLIRVTQGTAFFAEIDIRPNSPTFGQYFSTELSSDNRRQLWVPPGFANGFMALSEWCEVQYKCTAYWNPNGEGAIAWNEPEVGIKWLLTNPIVSPKDEKGMQLADWLKKQESDNFKI